MNTLLEDPNECRICYDEVKEPKKYCNCSGSQGNIHPECVMKSITADNTRYINRFKLIKRCELCNRDINIIQTRNTKAKIIYVLFFILYGLMLFGFIYYIYYKDILNFHSIYSIITSFSGILIITVLYVALFRYLVHYSNIYEYKIKILEIED